MMYRRRRRLTPEEKAANEAARDARAAKAMTCQVCGSGILANTGVIAHHGYRRPPGWHSQTASCAGARELPFEADHKVLDRCIALATSYHAGIVEALALARQPETPAAHEYYEKHGRLSLPKTVRFDRASLDQVRAEHPEWFKYRERDTFEQFKKQHVWRLEQDEDRSRHSLDRMNERRLAWKLTHRFTEGGWVKL